MWACSSANGRAFRGRPHQRRTPHSLARFSRRHDRGRLAGAISGRQRAAGRRACTRRAVRYSAEMCCSAARPRRHWLVVYGVLSVCEFLGVCGVCLTPHAVPTSSSVSSNRSEEVLDRVDSSAVGATA